ncbi:acyl-CoA synthetase [Bacillus sp. SA1-12]|uniref:AMP-binding protein n=1 Tax=Bacillus sp. SA1-12 TaxID=1455638 RepID=UPI0006262613|nr:AMP-binding protein [Bacillus sp. SA1-12]KKI94039.1 acyl-CoA synthetase [Bacillus sp. SA1-12]
MSITAAYEKNAQQFPEKVALQTEDESISYRNWYQLICQTANWLASIKRPNNVVGVFMQNGLPFLQLFSSASEAGLVVVPFDVKWTTTEIKRRIKLSQPSMIITMNDKYQKIKEIDQNVIVWEECLGEIKRMPVYRETEMKEDLPFYMGFTSGSTGEPKAFIRSHESWVQSFACTQFDFHISKDDHVLIPGSLIHSHFLFGAISTLFLGGSVYLLSKFSPAQSLEFIETKPITVIYVVPTMLEAFLKDGCQTKKQLKIISSGAKWEEFTKQRIKEMFPNSFMYEFYGASELSFVTVLTDDDNKRKPGSVGKPCHNVDVQIRTSTGDVLAPNEIGKIFVRSNMLFSGYLQANKLGIHPFLTENGWMTVDDMGYIDAEGFLYIIGREKNMILYGGINIYAEEVEAVLASHPEVYAAAVVGTSDPYWGQVVSAVIQGRAKKAELRRLCKMKLSPYKIPRKWYFLDELPLTTSGKIARPKIIEMLERKVNGD